MSTCALPVLDAAWLRALHVLAVNSIGVHSLALAFSRFDGWRLEAVFADPDSLNQAGAALGLEPAHRDRHGVLRRTGIVLGVPMTCLCWKSGRETTDAAPAPAGSGSTRPRGYGPAPAPAHDDLLDLLED